MPGDFEAGIFLGLLVCWAVAALVAPAGVAGVMGMVIGAGGAAWQVGAMIVEGRRERLARLA